MADDRDLFGDLGDFDDLGLDETPSFDFGEEELVEFAPPQEEGVGRTFKIVGALIGLGVVVIVALLVVFALGGGGDELTANEKLSTEIAGTNVALESQYNATLTALAQIEQATQTQFSINSVTGTAEFFQQQTIAAQRATDQANTATAEFVASQTAAAQQTATQEGLSEEMTATAEANRLFGRVIDKDGNIFGNATLRLYRDDGDGVFTPADRTPVPGGGGAELSPGEGGAGAGPGASSGEPQPINYGEIAQGAVGRGETAVWTFTGTRGDSVIINAIASDPVQMDMFLELVGPDGSMLIGDDDSGEESNAAITGFVLPQDGKYTIRVSSVAGPGSYTLLLSLGLTVPGPAAQPTVEAPAEEPTQETGQTGQLVPGSEGIVLAHSGASQGEPGMVAQEGTPTATQETLPSDTPVPPTNTPAPPTGDELIDIITTATDGTFDFGSLEPGVYWVELDYDSLPPELKALVQPGQPLVIKVIVPIQGEFIFEVGAELPPTPVPTGVGSPSPFELMATAFGARTGTPPVDIVTLTPSVEPGTPAMPETGFFSDMGDKGDDIDGTSGLTVLAIAAAGLVAVVFIARKLRNSA